MHGAYGVAPWLVRSANQNPFGIGLPNPFGWQFHRRQQSAAVAVRVEADQVSDVEDLGLVVGGVTDDGGATAEVRVGDARPERVPAKKLRRLLIHFQVRIVGCMGEEELIVNEIVAERVVKRFMFGRQEIHFTVEIVAFESLDTPVPQPRVVWFIAPNDVEHHFLVVALQRNELCFLPQFNQSIDHALRIWTPVDVITERDNQVFGSRFDGSQQGLQRFVETVNVADRDESSVQVFISPCFFESSADSAIIGGVQIVAENVSMLTPLVFSTRCSQPSAVDCESPMTPLSESFAEPDRWWGRSRVCSLKCCSIRWPVAHDRTQIRTKPPVKGPNSEPKPLHHQRYVTPNVPSRIIEGSQRRQNRLR